MEAAQMYDYFHEHSDEIWESIRNAHSAGKKSLGARASRPHNPIHERSFEESCGQDARAPRVVARADGMNSTGKFRAAPLEKRKIKS